MWPRLQNMADRKLLSVNLVCPNRNKTSWENVLKIFCSTNIRCSNLTPTNEGFRALFPTLSEIEKVFSTDVSSKLNEYSVSAIKPTYLTTSRTIIALRANQFLMEHSKEEITDNINQNNEDWLEISHLYKFPSGKTFKFECKTMEMANRCLKTGFHGFNLSVSPHDLTLEEVSQVTYCFKCYAIDDHMVKACTKLQSYRVCSLCSSKQHTYKDCTSTDRKCINCNGAHATMSKSCPSYKVAAAKVPMERPLRKTGTQYPPAQHKNSTQEKPSTDSRGTPEHQMFGLTREDMFRGFMSVVIASTNECSQPGSFNETLSKLLHENGLPTFNMADVKAPRMSKVGPEIISEGPQRPPANSDLQSTPPFSVSETENDATAVSPSQHSEVFKRRKIATRSLKHSCIIFARNNFQFGKGKIIKDIIKDKNSVINHSCPNTSDCMKTLKIFCWET